MAIGKAVASVASILLVVGVAIGVVTFVNKGGISNSSLNAHQKAVQQICQSTTDKGSCEKTLEPVQSDDPKKLIKAFLLATKDAINKSSDFTASTEGKLGPNINETNKAVLDYCKKVLSYAIEDLETIVEEMGEDLENSGTKVDQLKQWLTGVFNYQSDCLDDIEDEELKKIMDEGIANSKILSSNALDIFDSVVAAMSQMGVTVDDMKISESIAPRHLLENIDEDGLPNWHSGADRKLMAEAGRDDGIGEGGGGGGKIKPTHVVAKDGSGQFKTIQAAVNACPDKNPGRCIIYIKAGVYNEVVSVPKKKNNVFMFGDGATQTIITNNRSVKLTPGMTTSLSATVQVESEGFMAKWIGFKNTAGPLGHQAVAFRNNGDRAVIFNCRFDAFQDTLYTNNGRQFYRNIVVSGTVDFIFGRSAAVIQNSLILVRKGTDGQSNYVTADGNEKGRSVKIGIVLHNCRIMADKDLEAVKATTKSYLGRPWKMFSTTVIMGTEIGDMIQPIGWTEWQGNNNHKTCKYIEFNNRGPGADTSQRLPFVKVAKSAAEVQTYAVASWIGPANWIQEANVPVQLGV